MKHGCAKRGKRPSEYNAWVSMIARCENPNRYGFVNYGGRGIRVCDRWRLSFLDFLSDVGPKPSPVHSLDRIDVDGNYEPLNVRWATRAEQRVNQRKRARTTGGIVYAMSLIGARQ